MLVLILRNYNTLERRTFEEWSSILDLSTRWGFTSIRDLAIRCIGIPDPLKKLTLARKYAIDKWIHPALFELCMRPQPLSLEEARLMDFEDAILVGSVRQTVRSSALMVRGTRIRDYIQAWKSGPVPMAEPSSVPASPSLVALAEPGSVPASPSLVAPAGPSLEAPAGPSLVAPARARPSSVTLAGPSSVSDPRRARARKK